MNGGIELYCANCGTTFNTDKTHYYHSGTDTTLCSRKCHNEMEYRYAARILGKPTDRTTAQTYINEKEARHPNT